MDNPAKTLEQRILEPVLTAGYGELTEFAGTLAHRINDIVSFDEKPTGADIAAVLFAWAQANAKDSANG
ncbi:hypothetical protein [Bosea sp. FBZP-16]|uniref:hypothetical protein n=1 Tax=Bosea sp. FBZP-16 TaxID=2065382 RepID=UPI000C317FCB|nr:hypothetical protein [Bosea sp. FBZP-16]